MDWFAPVPAALAEYKELRQIVSHPEWGNGRSNDTRNNTNGIYTRDGCLSHSQTTIDIKRTLHSEAITSANICFFINHPTTFVKNNKQDKNHKIR